MEETLCSLLPPTQTSPNRMSFQFAENSMACYRTLHAVPQRRFVVLSVVYFVGA